MKKTLSLALIFVLLISVLASCGESGIKTTNLSFGDSAEAYKNGTIDAFFCTAGEPTAAVTELATAKDFTILPVTGEYADKLIESYPFYIKHTITAGTYSNITEDVECVAVMATIIASNDMSEDAVYNLTKAYYEAASSDTIHHDKATNINLENALNGLGGVPLHKGAAKYYAEALNITVEELAEKYSVKVSETAGTNAPETIRFTTGGDAGTYYAFGGSIATGVNAILDGAQVTAITSGGSKANIIAIDKGEAEIGWVQNDVMYYAYTGTDLFAGQSYSSFSVIAVVYPETCQIIASKDVTSVADLATKRVSIGDAGSGVEFNAKQILAAYGITVG